MGPKKELSIKFFDEHQWKDEDSLSYSDDDDDDADSEFDVSLLSDLENVQEKSLSHQGKYNFMSEADVRRRQEDDINNISDILSVSRAEASILLLHFKWNIAAVPEAWFTDGQKLREELGLLEFPTVGVETFDAKVTCGICLGTFTQDLTAASFCGHIYCLTCWSGVIKASVIDGPACLMLRCPHPSCRAAVGQDMINMLASDDDKKIYEYYFLKSYIDYKLKAKWCPASGCNFVVILVSESWSSKVTCKCSYSFCWKCTKEHHQPITCAALKNWELENLIQSENRTITNTKDCPNCGQSVEVNRHFKRMECASCKFQFCKVCVASWLKYGFWEGDQYTHVCSVGKLKQPIIADDEQQWMNQDGVIRFHETQSQWKARDVQFQATLIELQTLQNGLLKTLAAKQGQSEADMSFVREAWLQIADCKRILKWACVYEYYIPNHETDRRYLLNYLLRGAEFVLEHLHQSASEMITFLNMDKPSAEYKNLRIRLFSQTSVARNYFDNMVWAVETGFLNLNAFRRAMRSRKSEVFASASGKDEQCGDPNRGGYWNCAQCQFPNEASALTCIMCH